MNSTLRRSLAVLCAAALAAACSSDSSSSPSTSVAPPSSTDVPSSVAPVDSSPITEAPTTSTAPADTTVPAAGSVLVGAASASVLPTVGGTRDYVADSPGWADVDPFDPGVFVPAFDQGQIDVGNGNSDAAWVHDDLLVTSVAMQKDDSLVVMVSADLYMIFAADGAEIERRARALLPPEWQESAKIIISATHNHEGPDSGFSINDDWYSMMADQAAATVAAAVENLEPATLAVATGEHRFGVADARDPVVIDPGLKVMTATSVETGDVIATIVQWASHPETTLGFEPADGSDIADACAAKGWSGDDCSANGRYFTADYPGVLRDMVRNEIGGEVLYFNGAIGSQIGPGDAPVWTVDETHPVGNGWTVPDGAQPVPGAADLSDENFATTEAIGTQLGLHVLELIDQATAVDVPAIEWREKSYLTRLTNIGFRLLLADGDLGWQSPTAYTCSGSITDSTCISDNGSVEDDPVLTPLTGSQIRVGDVLRTRLVHVAVGDVGFLFMPGELPPELVIGLPADWATNSDSYYPTPGEDHARGADYGLPGYLLNLVDNSVTFTVGLGGDELGYFVPMNEVKLRCAGDILGPPGDCQRAYEKGYITYVDGVSGYDCRQLTDYPLTIHLPEPELYEVFYNSCRYGQALGREFGEPPGHYEETNSAGWRLVEDLWAASLELFEVPDPGQPINPDNPGYTLTNPPPS